MLLDITAASDLVCVSSHHKDRSAGTVVGNGTQPEVQTRVLVPQTCVPHKQVQGSVGQEELKGYNIS